MPTKLVRPSDCVVNFAPSETHTPTKDLTGEALAAKEERVALYATIEAAGAVTSRGSKGAEPVIPRQDDSHSTPKSVARARFYGNRRQQKENNLVYGGGA